MTERVLGPTGSPRRRWTLLLPLTLVIVTGFVFVIGAGANLTGSSFEGNDANLVVNTAGNKDWDNAPNLAAQQDLPKGNDDNSFGQGSKEDDVNVTVGGGSIPNSKANLARFAVAGETISGQSFLYLAWSREDASGTVNFDFEINAAEQPDLVAFGPKTLVRTVNDLLINYSFQGGSATNVALTVRKWNGTAWGTETPISSACSEGLVNSAPVSDTLGGLAAVSRPAGQFGEASINLVCAGVIPPNTCAPFSSAYVKSRSSTAFNSEIKDFIAPVHLSITACGSIKVIKHTDPRGLNQVFNYTTTGTGLSAFSLNDNGNTTGDSAANTKLFSGLQPGSYSVTEGTDPAGFGFDSLACTGGGANTTTSGKVATIGLEAGEDIVCTYVNKQLKGAIVVTKTRKHAAGGAGAQPHPGVDFTVNGVTKATGADGKVCFDGLTFAAAGTSYNVTETLPAGYQADGPPVGTLTKAVTVSAQATCGPPVTGTPATVSFANTPLTNVTISVDSQVPGGTDSQVDCTGTNLDLDTDNTTGDGTVTASNLTPKMGANVITCTITIDP